MENRKKRHAEMIGRCFVNLCLMVKDGDSFEKIGNHVRELAGIVKSADMLEEEERRESNGE
ncbi:hypothetical protein E5358_08405 [Palleniella muris]|uniref:Uncharacterized protein n=1 Tax=Palleniella muris TaxID=3038145 RepID=A0AC61QPX5_9BACT|nr:hypothetical protein [Palleniella muris]TGX82071.1 hypothetical protein E5358_08405 [Palleniella muris]